MTRATVDPFFVRLRRAAARGPRYVAWRATLPVRERLREPWTRLYPSFVTGRSVARQIGAADIDAAWRQLEDRPFFLRPADRDGWIATFRRAYPGAADDLIARADAAVRHEFDLLGSGPCALGAKLPWRTDFKTGREWPLEYASTIEYLELDRDTDVKVPWELSRCQHFPLLGQAYWFTGDECYAREYVSEITDWIQGNPWGYGVNWVCAMDVALRALSWIWGFFFFARSSACRDTAFRDAFLRSLYLHGAFVEGHLEVGEINGNHYLSDAVGLVALGAFFGASSRGRRWLSLGRRIVGEEIVNQTYEDGVDHEQSVAYHRLVVELFVTAFEILRRAGVDLPASAWGRLEKMHEFTAAYQRPDGTVPLLGDADDGRAQKLGNQGVNDHRSVLSTGAVLFDRPDFKAAAQRFWEESFWLLGPEAAVRFERLPEVERPAGLAAFPRGGLFVLRNRRAQTLVDCAEVGLRGLGGHGHNDTLSFDWWVDGSTVVSDCGTFVYTASREWRNRFRGTAFHNTVQLDDEEVNRFVGPDVLFQMHYDAEPFDVRWSDASEAQSISAAHRGYARLSPPAIVRRELVLREDGTLAVRDRIEGVGTRRVRSRFHLDPAVQPSRTADGICLAAPTVDAWLYLVDAPPGVTATIDKGWVSPTYGVKCQAHVVVLDAQATALPSSMTCVFATRPLTRAERDAARNWFA